MACLSAGQYGNHVGPELAQLVAVFHRTLRAVFANVRMIPCARILFLASDGPLGADIAALLGGAASLALLFDPGAARA